MPSNCDPNLLVGFDKNDDACAYKISEDLVLIQTVDFFPPIVDDPYLFGQIAASNSLSDVYAMGGSPSIALNILGLPSCLPPDTAALILAGGASKVKEAGAIIAGGHTIEDAEPKYGMCVTGFVHPSKIWSNSGAKPGDVLVLTKPLGNGILATAAKQDKITPGEFMEATKSMATLNKYARDAAQSIQINACTDITGFGLFGHAHEMSYASGVTLNFESEKLPVFDGVTALAAKGVIPGGAKRNEKYLEGKTYVDKNVSRSLKHVLFDPQTSGGLLFSVPKRSLQQLLENLKGAEVPAVVVGYVSEKGDYFVVAA